MILNVRDPFLVTWREFYSYPMFFTHWKCLFNLNVNEKQKNRSCCSQSLSRGSSGYTKVVRIIPTHKEILTLFSELMLLRKKKLNYEEKRNCKPCQTLQLQR